MLLSELLDELEICRDDGDVLVEVNGVQYKLTEVQDTSQGVVLIVDTDEEERELR